MTDMRNRSILEVLLAVGISFLFSRLDILNAVYLVPVLVVCESCHGARRYLPVFLAGLLAVACTVFQARAALASKAGTIAVCISVFLPTMLWISALIWISLGRKSMMRRYLTGASAGALGVLGFLIYLSQGGEAAMKVYAAMQDQFVSLFASFGLADGAEGQLFSRNLVQFYRTVVLAMGCTACPLVMLFAGLNQFLALSMVHKGDDGFSEKLSNFHVANDLIWCFLGLWFAVCFGYFSHAPYLVRAILINLAGCVTLVYGIQGFAIMLYRSRQKRPLSATSLFWRLFIIMALVPLVNTLLMCVIPLIGVTETWIQYRKPKEN